MRLARMSHKHGESGRIAVCTLRERDDKRKRIVRARFAELFIELGDGRNVDVADDSAPTPEGAGSAYYRVAK